MKYWLIDNGEPTGPYTASDLRQQSPESSTPVWREGLTDWITLAELPEYDEIFNAEQQLPPPLPVQEYIATPSVTPQSPTIQAYPPGADVEKFASTYLGWSIAVTLLCCIPLGIVSIIMSMRVNSLNIRGEYEAARRVSRNTELWIIASITLGLVTAPFMMMVQMMSLI